MPSFSDQTSDWARRAEAKMELAIRKIAIEAFSRVILRSPVDTGRFRGNWNVSLNQIDFTSDPSIMDPSGQSMIGEAIQIASGMKNDETIYLINNLPYANRLENGWSQQAPNGMVKLTVLEFQPIVKAIADQLRNER